VRRSRGLSAKSPARTPALVGATLFEQVLSLGLTNGAPFEATSTNALELQLGLFGG